KRRSPRPAPPRSATRAWPARASRGTATPNPRRRRSSSPRSAPRRSRRRRRRSGEAPELVGVLDVEPAAPFTHLLGGPRRELGAGLEGAADQVVRLIDVDAHLHARSMTGG